MLLREAFVALNDLVLARLAERGHGAVRPAHSAVFQYLDDTGTTVSLLAERAQMTKQAMAELVRHLETHGYVVRVPDPTDGRAKLVLPTDRGREVIAMAQELVPEIEDRISRPARRGPHAGPPRGPGDHPARRRPVNFRPLWIHGSRFSSLSHVFEATKCRTRVLGRGHHHRDIHKPDSWTVHIAPDGLPTFIPPASLDPHRTPPQPLPPQALASAWLLAMRGSA